MTNRNSDECYKESIIRSVVGCVLVGSLSLSTPQAFAIEGLKITVPSTNVVLSWPSAPSETYLIQYRHTLNATDAWATLADFYTPNTSGTNITYFYDTNIDYGTGVVGGGSGGSGTPPVPSIQNGPLAMPSDGSGDAVPLSLYPPGIDLS